MSLYRNSVLLDYDEDTSAGSLTRLYALTETPKKICVHTAATFDSVGTEFFVRIDLDTSHLSSHDLNDILQSGDLRKWGPPSADELLGEPLAFFDCDAAAAEPIVFRSTRPTLTRSQQASVPSVESPGIEDAPLGPDDDYDDAKEDEEERELERTNALALAVHGADVCATGPSTAASPPLSSEAPSPASARDFGSFHDDDVSDFYSESSSTWDVESHLEYDVSDASNDDALEEVPVDGITDHDGDEDAFEREHDASPLLGDLTDDDAQGEDDDADGQDDYDASHLYQLEEQHSQTIATVAVVPIPRPIIPLPSRSRATPATASQVVGPSTLSHYRDDSDPEPDDDYSEPTDDEESSEYEDYPTTSKRRRANSGEGKAAPPKRGKAKAAAPKRRAADKKASAKIPAKARATKPKYTEPEEEAPEPILVAADAPRPKYVENSAGLYPCPLAWRGCTHKPCGRNGTQRHYNLDHKPEGAKECEACGKKLQGRNEILLKHLRSVTACTASQKKKQAAIEKIEANSKKRKRSARA
ncbi:hypothetical protein C8R45DRAFT_1089102 [Mycena sanguinolenta]|nr:hypothetical protein C8R45DRAFT_1089102 [Mycena sanguinolenta]